MCNFIYNYKKRSSSKENDLAKGNKNRLNANEKKKSKTIDTDQEPSQLKVSNKYEFEPLVCDSYSKGIKSNWTKPFVSKNCEHLQQADLSKKTSRLISNAINGPINEAKIDFSNESSLKQNKNNDVSKNNSKVCFVKVAQH